MNYFSYKDFEEKWLGKSSSLGGYKNQCVTLFKEFLNKAGYPNPGRAIGGSGGAREIWHRRNELGYGDYFNFEQVGHPGDWFVWDSVYGWYKGTYYGHVAMLIKDNGNGTGQFLGMNQGSDLAPGNIQTLTYNGSCGVLHYKGYSMPQTGTGVTTYDPNKLVEEHAIARMTVDQVAVRQGSPSGTVIKRLNTNDTFEYFYKVAANGHRWVVNHDKTQFVAISNSEEYGKELWAEFLDPTEEVPKQDTPKQEETTPTPEPIDYTKNIKGYGVDLSEHNPNIDVSQYDFVILRACYGENTDKLFESYVKKCEDASIPYGVYCYDYALNDDEAKAQAEYCLNLIKDKNIQLGVWIDMEDADHYKSKNGVLTKDRCTSSCKIFCDMIKEAGYYTGVYTSLSWIKAYVVTDYPLWIAAWNENDGNVNSDQSSIAVMHQYTSKPIDKDVIYHDVGFYKSNPKEEETNGSTNEKINISGLNKIIEIITKILNRIFKTE